MTSAPFELRTYQTEALRELRKYLQKVPFMGAKTAFYDVTGTPYSPAPLVDENTPYVCIRIPTGGGKTIVAAHAVGVAAKEYLQAEVEFFDDEDMAPAPPELRELALAAKLASE